MAIHPNSLKNLRTFRDRPREECMEIWRRGGKRGGEASGERRRAFRIIRESAEDAFLNILETGAPEELDRAYDVIDRLDAFLTDQGYLTKKSLYDRIWEKRDKRDREDPFVKSFERLLKLF